MQVDRPIFIMGPHRSGTTLLYNILAAHPDVGYFNRANRRFVQRQHRAGRSWLPVAVVETALRVVNLDGALVRRRRFWR